MKSIVVGIRDTAEWDTLSSGLVQNFLKLHCFGFSVACSVVFMLLLYNIFFMSIGNRKNKKKYQIII